RDTISALLQAGAPILPNPTTPPTTVHCDNTSVISTVQRGHIAGRVRHVRIDISFLFDAVLARDIRLSHCPSLDMRANFLTKSEPRILFKESLAFLFPA
ncbi:MAG: hypothetical protein ACO38I_11035, partial [Ilumatobacteraceae bacterium]